MDVAIVGRPAFAHIKVKLSPGDRITMEAGAMASMSSQVELNARWNGGFFGAWLRKWFGGESLFVNEATLGGGASAGELTLTQPTPGDIHELTLRGTAMYIQSGAYIANEPGVALSVGWAGFSSWLGGEGLFRLKVSGTGRVWIGGYGAIHQQEIADVLIVDSNHLVAYEPTVRMKAGLAGGLITSFMSGEGLVLRMHGPGRVLVQTRSLEGLARWTNAHL